jgi:Cd2+/Zn2+-exporting ATPase
MKQKTKNEKLIFIGDGINDAPVLARADVGIAMGDVGADVAIEVADVVILNGELSKIATAIKIAKKTMKIVKQNIIFSIGTKFIILILSILNYTSVSLAIFADVGVLIVTVLNSLFLYKITNNE